PVFKAGLSKKSSVVCQCHRDKNSANPRAVVRPPRPFLLTPLGGGEGARSIGSIQRARAIPDGQPGKSFHSRISREGNAPVRPRCEDRRLTPPSPSSERVPSPMPTSSSRPPDAQIAGR